MVKYYKYSVLSILLCISCTAFALMIDQRRIDRSQADNLRGYIQAAVTKKIAIQWASPDVKRNAAAKLGMTEAELDNFVQGKTKKVEPKPRELSREETKVLLPERPIEKKEKEKSVEKPSALVPAQSVKKEKEKAEIISEAGSKRPAILVPVLPAPPSSLVELPPSPKAAEIPSAGVELLSQDEVGQIIRNLKEAGFKAHEYVPTQEEKIDKAATDLADALQNFEEERMMYSALIDAFKAQQKNYETLWSMSESVASVMDDQVKIGQLKVLMMQANDLETQAQNITKQLEEYCGVENLNGVVRTIQAMDKEIKEMERAIAQAKARIEPLKDYIIYPYPDIQTRDGNAVLGIEAAATEMQGWGQEELQKLMPVVSQNAKGVMSQEELAIALEEKRAREDAEYQEAQARLTEQLAQEKEALEVSMPTAAEIEELKARGTQAIEASRTTATKKPAIAQEGAQRKPKRNVQWNK